MTGRLLVLVPLRIEAAAIGSRPGWHVLRTGLGPARARIAAARGLGVEDAVAVVVAGVCAAVSPGLGPGDLVCATELRRSGSDPLAVPAGALLATALRRHGLRAHAGPVASADHLAGPDERHGLEGTGLLALDMESAWLADAAGGRPFAVVRAVVEPSGRRLADPRTLPAGIRALVALRRAGAAFAEWAEEAGASQFTEPLDLVSELTPR